MITIKDKRECCGCSACASVCPKRCITMCEDNEGFLYPFVDTDICIECGLCENICPVIHAQPDEKKETVAEAACIPDARDNTVIVISSDRMGEGEEELGKVLIKGYIYALTQLETLPKTILFYNKGAYLTCEGSASLEDLKSLEAQGVEIFTCGTCLNYYGLSEKLQVGSVTNMYVIADTMAKAGKVVKP